ncbi:hypothetical protein R3P38DRAFT_415155 [Favolaschia claudopus]|uniref:Mediator of RNA polymerase II transcription subunit 29 n=1 Tax=Favolaschia claudopus TaxID=2862362 RepID=A0AAV9ZH08_9AGAR
MIPTPVSSNTYPMASHSMTGFPPLQPNFNAVPQFNPNSAFLPPSSSQEHSLHQGGTDPNSPELFQQNMQLVQQSVLQLQEAAKRALDGIQNAYRIGHTPTQTEADLATLNQTLQMVCEQMRQTGVGGLPLLPVTDPNEPPAMPTEEQLMAQTTRAVQVPYEQLKRGQDSAQAVVANLVAGIDRSSSHR